MITILHRGGRGGWDGGRSMHLLHFLINFQNTVLGGSVQMITISHRGGRANYVVTNYKHTFMLPVPICLNDSKIITDLSKNSPDIHILVNLPPFVSLQKFFFQDRT